MVTVIAASRYRYVGVFVDVASLEGELRGGILVG